MREEIKIPSLGESISEVTVASFLKKSGSYVQEGEEIVELETEKVNQVLFAPKSGEINWNVKEGDKVAVGSLIGQIDTEKQGEKKESPPPMPATVPPQKEKAQEKEPIKKETGSIRKTKEDFVAEIKREEPKAARVEPKGEKKETRKPMSKIRQTIASRLVESLRSAAMLTTFNEVDMSAIMDLRTKYKETFQKKYGLKLGYMPFFVKATIEALREFPDFNSYLDKNEIVQRHTYDIGIAVAAPKGLVVPVVRSCDLLKFAEIEKEIEEYAERAKSGRLAIQDLEGGGFTITNGGVFGSLLSTPILNLPQVGILGMHKIEKRAVVIDDQIAIRPMMYLALSYDHRIVDGKEAVTFLVRIKEYLEDPSRLILFESDGTI